MISCFILKFYSCLSYIAFHFLCMWDFPPMFCVHLRLVIESAFVFIVCVLPDVCFIHLSPFAKYKLLLKMLVFEAVGNMTQKSTFLQSGHFILHNLYYIFYYWLFELIINYYYYIVFTNTFKNCWLVGHSYSWWARTFTLNRNVNSDSTVSCYVWGCVYQPNLWLFFAQLCPTEVFFPPDL